MTDLFSKFDETLDLLGEFLDSRPPSESVADALRAASREFASMGSAVGDDKAAFAVFTSSEALHGRYLQSFFRLESLAGDWIASRTGLAPEDGLPRMLAAVLASGARVALDVWVEQPGQDLQDLLEVPLRMIEAALARP